jgi:hypothetical protein
VVAHYAASGWLPLLGDDEGLIDLVSEGAAEGRPEPLPDKTEYRVLVDESERFELWLYAAHGQVRGAVPYLRGDVRWDIHITGVLPRVTGGMGAIEVHREGEPDRVVCVELPDFGLMGDDLAGNTRSAAITGLAYMCRTVPPDEEQLCLPRLYPYGMVHDPSVSAGEGSRCDVLACGRIVSARQVQNQLTDLSVWLLELEVAGVPLSVAAAPGMVQGDEPQPGRLFEGVFWLVGRIEADSRNDPGLLGRAMHKLTGR